MQTEHTRTPDDEAVELTKKLPMLVDRRFAHALVEAAYDLHHKLTPEIDRATEPFVRVTDTVPFDP